MIVWRLFYVVLFISVALLAYAVYTLATVRGSLDNIPASFSFGPPDAGLHVVAFIDYDCGNCRAANAAMITALEKDGNVRYSPLVLSNGTKSEYATNLTYSASLQKKYKDAYQYFMENDSDVDANDITDIGLQIGIEEKVLAGGLKEPIMARLIEKTDQTFSDLGASSVPTFFIGPSIKFAPEGTPSADDFLKLFAEARGK
jgi:protein-disulfide isomerase